MKLARVVTLPSTGIVAEQRVATAPTPPTTIHAVVGAETGTAILTATKDAADLIEVLAIERLPAGLEPAASWLETAVPGLRPDRATRVIVDAAGLGSALWTTLGVRNGSSWQLYDKRGRDRQELVNALLVAEHERRIRIRPSPHGDAMRRALLAYRRVVEDDGLIGAELVVALALCALARRAVAPRVY